MQIVIVENYGVHIVEVDGQTRGPMYSSAVAAQHAAQEFSNVAEREGRSGAAYERKGAGPQKKLLWEFGGAA